MPPIYLEPQSDDAPTQVFGAADQEIHHSHLSNDEEYDLAHEDALVVL